MTETAGKTSFSKMTIQFKRSFKIVAMNMTKLMVSAELLISSVTKKKQIVTINFVLRVDATSLLVSPTSTSEDAEM